MGFSSAKLSLVAITTSGNGQEGYGDKDLENGQWAVIDSLSLPFRIE